MPPKKSTKRKTLRRRRAQKAGYYSFSGAVAPGAAAWSRQSEYGGYALSSRGGNTQYGRGRKGKGKKTRKMRGGSKFGAVSASYAGTGQRGMIDVVPTTTKYPSAGTPELGMFNYHGAKPGDFSSFK